MKRLAAFKLWMIHSIGVTCVVACLAIGWALGPLVQSALAQWLPLGTPGPGVWLDFGANVGCVSATSCLLNSTAVSLVTTTRTTTTGTATCADAAGNYTQFADNTTRWGAGAGACIEEARTNVVLRSRDLTNAAWTKTNVTAALDQIGIDGTANGASSILSTAGNGTALQAITLGSSARFQSAFVRRLIGTGVVNMTMDNGSTWTAVTVTGTWTRVSIPTQTLANPTVGFQIVTIGDKIAIDIVQNENGASQSTPIITTSAAGVRGADVTTVTSPPTFGAAYTPYLKMSPFAPTGYGSVQVGVAITDGTNSNRLQFVRNNATGTAGIFMSSGGVSQYNQSGAAWAQNAAGKFAAAGTAGDQSAAFNGTLLTVGTGATMPVGVSAIDIGHLNGSAQCNCQILQFGLWNPYRMPNAALQTQTTLP